MKLEKQHRKCMCVFILSLRVSEQIKKNKKYEKNLSFELLK